MGFKTKLSDYLGFKPKMIEKGVKDTAENAKKLKAMPHPIPEDSKNEILTTIIEGAKDGDLAKIAKLQHLLPFFYISAQNSFRAPIQFIIWHLIGDSFSKSTYFRKYKRSCKSAILQY